MPPVPSFARTKIQPPRPRPGLVERRELEARLGEALARDRLVLLVAPAGFGKTAALTRQLARLPDGTAVAWIACDGDDDLNRFAACLVAALDPYDLPWRTAPESLAPLLAGGAAEQRAATVELVNALAATEVPRGLIVIDDAHRLADPAVFVGLDLLIERLPAHWGVVIASRLDPPLALARWRARGELAEFRAEALRFAPEEVRALIASRGAGRDAPEALLARTGGWAAGLGLALSARGGPGAPGGPAAGAASRPSTPLDRDLFDYLTSEVLDPMPPALRGFLLRCSVLPELTAERCAQVSGDPRAAQHLEAIERQGLFVSLIGSAGDDEDAEPALVLHDLFRDCLDDRLRRELPQELPALLERAAEGEPDPARRLGYLLRGQHGVKAEAALLDAATALLTEGQVETLLRLVQQFPPTLAAHSPRLQMVLAMTGWARWQWRDMQRAARRALEGFSLAGEHAMAQRARAYLCIGLAGAGERDGLPAAMAPLYDGPLELAVLALRHHLEVWSDFDHGRLERLPASFEALLDVLERSDDPAVWYQCVPLPPFLGLDGMAEPLERYARGALARTGDAPGTLRAMAQGLAAGLRLWAGEVEPALAELLEAERDVRWLRQPQNASNMVYGQLAIAHALRGDAAAFEAACEVVLEQFRRRADDAMAAVRYAPAAFLAARWALGCGDEAAARRWLDSIDATHGAAERPVLVAHRATAQAYRAWLAGDLAAAGAGFEAALAAGTPDLFGHTSELRLRSAWARLAAGQPAEAAALLGPLFERHHEGRDIAALWLAGAPLLRALADHGGWAAWLSGEQRASLRRWADGAAACRQPSPHDHRAGAGDSGDAGSAGPVADPLSEREREVLARIAAGESNKLIARTLELSPHTVKRHVANILDKLGAASRGQAAAWYVSQRTR